MQYTIEYGLVKLFRMISKRTYLLKRDLVGQLFGEHLPTKSVRNLENSEIAGRCVVIDPGRRDLLYCVHEPSTAERPQKMRFIKPQQDFWTRAKKHRRILETVKTDEIRALERSLIYFI
ncbi:unnamed protein product [Rhizopus stolonifer]